MQHSSKHVAIAFLLGALITGGALGFTAARVFDREARATRSAETGRERLARELELSKEQKAKFDEILDRRDRTLDSLYGPVDAQLEAIRPSVKRVRDDARRELRAMLSAPQQREFDEYIAVMKEKARRDSVETARRRARLVKPDSAADTSAPSTAPAAPRSE